MEQIDLIDQIATQTRSVFEKYNIQKALLFGSIAKGLQGRKSDLDLILIQNTTKPYFERFDGILRDLYRVVRDKELDVFIYTPEELDRISHRKFIQTAFKEGRIIYESR